MHTTEIIRYEKLSNGQFAVIIRCCGNAGTDHAHTMAVSQSAEDRAKSIAGARAAVAKQHEDAIQAEMHVIGMLGSIETHE